MPYLAVDFEWSRGSTYEIGPLRDLDPPPALLPTPAWAGRRKYELQHPFEDGEWDDAGALFMTKQAGVVRSKKSPGLGRGDQTITQTGARTEKIQPLQLRPTLYADFAKLDGSAQACLKFASAWGLLFTPAKKGASETLAQWHRGIREVQGWIFSLDLDNAGQQSSLKSRAHRTQEVTMVGVDLVCHGSGRPTLVLRPQTLLDAMLVQLAQIAGTGGALRECQQCSTYFETGADNKRSDAKFCSDRCRGRFNYERRAK